MAFGPGGVVLGEPGDLLEELAPTLVVEPDGRDGLRRGSKSGHRVLTHSLANLTGGEVHADGVSHGRLRVLRQAEPAEGPAGSGGEEVSIGGAGMARWGGAASSAEHVLAHHELAVVLADRARRGAKARVGRIGAGRPLPYVAEHGVGGQSGPRVWRPVAQEVGPFGPVRGHRLPLGLSGESHTGPMGEGVRLVVTDVADRLLG